MMERDPSSPAQHQMPASMPPGIYPSRDDPQSSSSSEPTRTVPEDVHQEVDAVREHARSVKDQAKEQGQELGRRARSGVRQAREQGMQQARQAGSAIRDQAMSLIGDQTKRLAQQLGDMTEAARQASAKLHDEQDHNIAAYIDGAADYLDRARQYLGDRDPGSLLRDARKLARRRPEWFLGGMFVIGVAIARFAKAEDPRQDDGGSDYDAEDFAGDNYNRGDVGNAAWQGMNNLPDTYPPQPGDASQTVPVGGTVFPPASSAPPADIIVADEATAGRAGMDLAAEPRDLPGSADVSGLANVTGTAARPGQTGGAANAPIDLNPDLGTTDPTGQKEVH